MNLFRQIEAVASTSTVEGRKLAGPGIIAKALDRQVGMCPQSGTYNKHDDGLK